MALSEATKIENGLLERVRSASGTMQEKTAQLDGDGTFSAYRALVDQYLDLASDATDGMEALKRAVFIAWFECAEPGCFSGIAGISSEQRSAVLRVLDEALLRCRLDSELEWMLPWYHFIADWAFPKLEEFPAIVQFLGTSNPHAWEHLGLRAEQFAGRGQMGAYWASVVDAHSRRQP